MTTLYSLTIYASLALLAIAIAIFVFAASIYRGASEFFASEEEDALNRRKELIESRKTELTKRIPDIDGSTFLIQLRAELDRLDAELNNIDQSILKSRNKVKALMVWNMVGIPLSFLLVSIITSGIAIATSGTLPTIMWVLSLALLGAGSYFIYRNLSTVEFFSGVIDLGTLMERALEKHAHKMRSIVGLDIWDFELIIKRGETKEIEYIVSLEQGAIAKNVKVRFLATGELDFPDEEVVTQLPSTIKKESMNNPKQFVHKVDDLNPRSHSLKRFRVKVPDRPGKYTMSYWIQCEGFSAQEETFIIKVV